MNVINISKQKIFDNTKQLFAYDLVFMDSSSQETALSTSVKGTAQLIMSSITSKELDALLGRKNVAFINVDEHVLLKGILDVLDNKRFILNIFDLSSLFLFLELTQKRKRRLYENFTGPTFRPITLFL